MKKHLFISALLATACTLGTSAQSIEVTSSDGLKYKFAADRVEDITFVQTTPAEVCDFTSVDARIYSSGTVEATFSAENNPKAVTLWIVGPSMAKYFHDGVYNVSADGGAMTIDTDPSYSYVKEGTETKALKSGTMNVAVSGKEYTITFDLMLADDSELKGKYVGEMPGTIGKDFTLSTCEEPKVKTTDVNDYVKGEFYFKMNDSAWSYEMAVDFFADASAAKLPAGTYTYSEEGKPGTFGKRSSLDLYNPSNTYKFAEGSTITVAYEGENITLDMKLVTTDGRKIDMKYQGSIKFPEVVQEIETVALAAAATPKVINNNGRIDGEFYIKMNDAAWNYEMAIDLFADAAAEKIPAGTYTYSAENTPGTFGSKSYADMYTPNMGNCRFADGSKATVSYSGENIIIDLYLIVAEKNKALTMKYEGPINYEL